MIETKGRPMLFKTPEELQSAIDLYFHECESNIKVIVTKAGEVQEIKDPLIPNIAGLACRLGVDRHTVYNYSEKEDFFHTIKKARDYIYEKLENGLLNGSGSPVGKIFIAKNYGYADKQEIEYSDKYSPELKKKIEEIEKNV